MTNKPAGWYHDPGDPASLRYWDGATWTHHVGPAPFTAAPAATVPSNPTPPAPIAPRFAPPAARPLPGVVVEEKMLSKATVAIILVAALVGSVTFGAFVTGVFSSDDSTTASERTPEPAKSVAATSQTDDDAPGASRESEFESEAETDFGRDIERDIELDPIVAERFEREMTIACEQILADPSLRTVDVVSPELASITPYPLAELHVAVDFCVNLGVADQHAMLADDQTCPPIDLSKLNESPVRFLDHCATLSLLVLKTSGCSFTAVWDAEAREQQQDYLGFPSTFAVEDPLYCPSLAGVKTGDRVLVDVSVAGIESVRSSRSGDPIYTNAFEVHSVEPVVTPG